MGETFFLLADERARNRSLYPGFIGPDRFWHSPTALTWDESVHASDSMPNLRDERRLDVPRPSHDPALLGPYNSSGAHQSTNLQPHSNNAAFASGYGVSNLYGDEIGAGGCIRQESAAELRTNGLETIANGDCEEVCTTLSDQESSPHFTPDPASFEAPINDCACITCLKIQSYVRPSIQSRFIDRKFMCHFPSCLYSDPDLHQFLLHERRHYIQNGKYTCLEQGCQAVTQGFFELRRHYKKHCTSPDKEQFSCPVPWCKYSGNNGFLRNDKLKSHYRNIHEGKPGPLKAGRVIKPATLKPRVSSAGNGPSKQNE